ncbi:hypothetical protein MAPG_04952 [Magnaporthiopsis poae ATCC 64411]|uniref:Uncharacterized protein n=1 Tax=Magnaporthiopsis poae (strain ATCC 64411 / 73-15) TaxID=644358 RepID=A0A0C4DY43_MAGP6|nr:hypothetical protein MAPG_04952 [Magnaporthiopsis poae ATCC 64411]
MYRLGLLSNSPRDGMGCICTVTLVSSFVGLCFVTPGVTIRSMHSGAAGSAAAMRKLRALLVSFAVATGHRVASYYVVTWIHVWSGHTSWALNVESWGWYFEWAAAFIGSGMLIGLNSALSMFAGSVLAWGVIGPLLVHYGEANGHQVYPGQSEWDGQYSFASLSNFGKETPSPRYWLLWPGVMIRAAATVDTMIICDRQWGIHPGLALLSTVLASCLPSRPSRSAAPARAPTWRSRTPSTSTCSPSPCQRRRLGRHGPDVRIPQRLPARRPAGKAADRPVLFVTTYPCLIYPTRVEKCAFLAPSVAAWQAVIQAVTAPAVGISRSSAIAACPRVPCLSPRSSCAIII